VCELTLDTDELPLLAGIGGNRIDAEDPGEDWEPDFEV
jgi:hypothetical protein